MAIFAESRGGLAVTLVGTACLEAGARRACLSDEAMVTGNLEACDERNLPASSVFPLFSWWQ